MFRKQGKEWGQERGKHKKADHGAEERPLDLVMRIFLENQESI